MIWFWERKELTVTYDLSRRNKILDILAAEDVDYTVKASGRNLVSGRRGYVGSMGEADQYSVCYHIYVRVADFDRAMHLISHR